MSDELFPYYERELLFIRQMSQEFAREYPGAAGRLLLEPNRSADPHVERMIEAFALLAGRIHHKLDDEFPELTDALLSVLYPHLLAPVPSLAILHFDLDATRGQLPDGFAIPKGSRLHTQPVDGLPCKFQTCYPVTLWPVKLASARLQPPPFPPALASCAPPRSAAALRLQFDCLSQMRFADLSLDTLRLYLIDDPQVRPILYELLFNHATRVVFRPVEPDTAPRPIELKPQEVLKQVGFAEDEGLLPYSRRSFLGYRLLTEFFAFPSKFQFLDLGCWNAARLAGFGRKLEVVIFLNRTNRNVEQGTDVNTFQLGCTPVINLFEQTAEPIPVTHTRHEYLVTPDVGHPNGLEVYSVQSVVSTDPGTGGVTEYQPFYAISHSQSEGDQRAFWYATRRRALGETDRGDEVYLNLVDLEFKPTVPPASTLVVRTLCTNRNLPHDLHMAGAALEFELEAAAPLNGIRPIRVPTAALRPPHRRRAHWRLLSHLSLNHLSLTDPVEGRQALQEILRLYDFSEVDSGQQQMAAVNRQLIEGIESVTSRRVVGRVGGPIASGFCRGVEVSIEFDEQKYVGTGVFLMASVLERFLGLYASINSFSQLVARTTTGEGIMKKWPPRAGDQQLL
jgi:type VI secretion system protein ImpG